MSIPTLQAIAGGNISPSRFVRMGTNNNEVIQSAANQSVVGVSQPNTRAYPTADSSQYAAAAGEACEIDMPGTVTRLVIGSGGCTVGDWLESDANGAGIPRTISAGTVRRIGAKALETAAEGQLCQVLVWLFERSITAGGS